jgi:hypothetical protein
MHEIAALAARSCELAVVEVVVDGEPWAAIERNTLFFKEALV